MKQFLLLLTFKIIKFIPAIVVVLCSNGDQKQEKKKATAAAVEINSLESAMGLTEPRRNQFSA